MYKKPACWFEGDSSSHLSKAVNSPCEFGLEFLGFACPDLVDIVGYLNHPMITAQHL